MNEVIDFKGNKLFYYKYGTGPEVILLFHGFGQDHSAFDSWTAKLQADYRIISFDLYFHGRSTWNDSRPVEKEDWKEIIGELIRREKISEFELAGFSMGGKFAFATLESFPERVRGMTLIAPDGIKVNFWYRLATYPVAMRALFESFVANPKFFFSLARFLETIGVINKYLLRFVILQMDSQEKRMQVYCTWIQFRQLKFDMRLIADIIRQRNMGLKIIVGKFDKVIPVKDMNRLLKYVPDGRLEVVEAGHNNLIDKAIDFI